MCSNLITNHINTLNTSCIKFRHCIHNAHKQYPSHSKSPTELNMTLGRILRKVFLIQEVMICFYVTKNVMPPNCISTKLPSHPCLIFHLLHNRSNHILRNESKKQRDQCGSSIQYTMDAYNGERGLALPLMPLFICVS